MPTLAIMNIVQVLVVIGAVASSSLADDSTATNQFFPRRLSSEQRETILERARFLNQDSPDRPQLDANVLRSMNALPQFALTIDNAFYYFTRPFAFYGGRQLALAFVDVDGDVYARVLYRSNSQFTWRMCDATDGGHIGKGFHEFDKQLPIPVTVALLKMYDEVQPLQSPDGESVSQPDLAKDLLRGLTVDRRSNQCIREEDGSYYSHEYASFMPSRPMMFSRVSKWLPTATSVLVAAPKDVEPPPRDQLPDLRELLVSFRFSSPTYAVVNDGKGELVGRVFRSFDDSVRYLFFEDSDGRAVLSTVESLLPQVNAIGLRSRYLDPRGMDAPLIEYFLQIPKVYGGSNKAGYRSNWNYVRELPILAYYYAEQNRKVPPALVRVPDE